MPTLFPVWPFTALYQRGRRWLPHLLASGAFAAAGWAQTLPTGLLNPTYLGYWGNDIAEAAGTAVGSGIRNTAILAASGTVTAGSDLQWNLYNATPDKLIQVWSGTTSTGSSAYAFSVSTVGNTTFNGGYIGVLIDWTGDGTIDMGVALGRSSTTSYTEYTFLPRSGTAYTQSTTGNAANFQYTSVTTVATSGSNALAFTGSSGSAPRIAVDDGSTVDYMTFMVVQGDANTSGFRTITTTASSGNALFTAITGTSGTIANNLSITGDYVGSTSTFQFGTLNVPDPPTYVGLVGLLGPGIWLIARRRRTRT